MNLKSATVLQQEKERTFVPKEFKVTTWSKLKPYYNELLNRSIQSLDDLEQYVQYRPGARDLFVLDNTDPAGIARALELTMQDLR